MRVTKEELLPNDASREASVGPLTGRSCENASSSGWAEASEPASRRREPEALSRLLAGRAVHFAARHLPAGMSPYVIKVSRMRHLARMGEASPVCKG